MNGDADPDTIEWYLAQLKPNGDTFAEQHLRRQGFGVFAPKLACTRRHRGQFREEFRALFPGYIFVSVCSAAARWRAIGSTLGVQRLVSFGGAGPARVSAELVASLKQRCERIGRSASSPPFSKGDCVRVISGPFADFVGRIDQVPTQRRIWVLLDLMANAGRVALQPGQLELCAVAGS